MEKAGDSNQIPNSEPNPDGQRQDTERIPHASINLVLCHDQNETKLKVKTETRFWRVKDAWAKAQSTNVEHWRCFLDDIRIGDGHVITIADLGLEDGEQIEIFQEQVGGTAPVTQPESF